MAGTKGKGDNGRKSGRKKSRSSASMKSEKKSSGKGQKKRSGTTAKESTKTENGPKGKGAKAVENEKSPEEEKEKKTGINFLFLMLFVVGVFAVIILGVRLMANDEPVSIDELHKQNLEGELDPEEGYMYNGYSFVRAQGMWFTKIINKDTNEMHHIQLHFGPRQVENITIRGDITRFRDLNGTYMTFDPLGSDLGNVALAASELSINLAKYFRKNVVSACTKNETEICHKKDIVTCENNDRNPIIYIQESDVTGIVEDGNCIRIKGTELDLARAADRILYEWMGVMGGSGSGSPSNSRSDSNAGTVDQAGTIEQDGQEDLLPE
ncbi:MAG: hypothetical protein R6U32_05395 [Candidatus Woesearchaeota archaeon]